MYSPTLGRWMQMDPALFVDGNNLYQALEDNPSTTTDPLGLDALKINQINDTRDNTPKNIELGSPDFNASYLVHAGWSFSSADVAGWKQVGVDKECKCRIWKIDGHINTYSHNLLPMSADHLIGSVQQHRNNVARFNALAAQHEQRVIDLLQDVWSPNFKTCGDPGGDDEELKKELDRRNSAFKSAIGALDAADLFPMYSALVNAMVDAEVPAVMNDASPAKKSLDQKVHAAETAFNNYTSDLLSFFSDPRKV